jgi:hypothetical protein
VVNVGPTEAKIEAAFDAVCVATLHGNVFTSMRGEATSGTLDNSLFQFDEEDINRSHNSNDGGKPGKPGKAKAAAKKRVVAKKGAK